MGIARIELVSTADEDLQRGATVELGQARETGCDNHGVACGADHETGCGMSFAFGAPLDPARQSAVRQRT